MTENGDVVAGIYGFRFRHEGPVGVEAGVPAEPVPQIPHIDEKGRVGRLPFSLIPAMGGDVIPDLILMIEVFRSVGFDGVQFVDRDLVPARRFLRAEGGP